MPGKKRLDSFNAIVTIILTFWGIIIIFPFINVIALSFSTENEYLQSSYMLFPKRPTLDNFRRLMGNGQILIGYRTTLLIELISLPYCLFLTISLAYALSRPSFPGKKFFLLIFIFTMYFSGGIVPLYLWFRQLGLINTVWSVILPHGINMFYFLIVRNYISALPDSISESARIDGAGEWRILFRIILPLCNPILATFALFYAVDRWNEWYYPMIFIRKQSIVPLQVTLRNIVITAETNLSSWSQVGMGYPFSIGLKMAAVIVTMAPIMLVYPFLQKYFVKGMTIGAVKA
jgi:putative aldouronate transport system permease protein